MSEPLVSASAPGARLFPDAARPPAPPASLVGRHTERHHGLDALRRGARLLTLTGLGGVGKTTLARSLAAAWPGEAVWVECARLTRAEELPVHLLSAVGLSPTLDTLPLEALAAHAPPDGPPVLIVLDNLEQIEGAPLAVHDLLEVPARLRFLVTSRTPLGLRDEHLLPLAPLQVPDLDVDPDELALNDAVALFVQTARTVQPGFTLGAPTAPGIARLCRRLDGLPLALELAARHMDVLSPGTLLELLGRHGTLPLDGDLDRPERHRSLDALLDSTQALLTEAERRLFRVLAVFGSPFDATDAHAVLIGVSSDGANEATVLRSLLKFARQGLLVPATNEERVAFRMLETLRADAWRRLQCAGERDVAERAHAAHFRHLVLGVHRGDPPARQVPLQRDREGDVSRALGWFLARPEGDEDASRAALAMARVQARHFKDQGRPREGEVALRRALARPGTFPMERPGAIVTLALLLNEMGRSEEAVPLAESVEADLQALPDPSPYSLEFNGLATVLASAGHHERALGIWERLIDAGRRAGLSEADIDHHRYNAAVVLSLMGKHEEAQERFFDLAGRFRRRGDLLTAVRAYWVTGWSLTHLGRLDEAEGALERAHALAERDGLEGLRRQIEGDLYALSSRRTPTEATVENMRRLIGALRQHGEGAAAATHTVELGLASLLLGRADEARAAAEQAVDPLPGRKPWPALGSRVAWLRGLCAAFLGDAGEADTFLEEGLTDELRRVRPLEYAMGLQAWAAAREALGDAHGAAERRAACAALLRERSLTPWPIMQMGSPRRGGPAPARHEPHTLPTGETAPSLREREVLALLALGQTNKQIARTLGLSENTVRAHLRALSQKLGEHTRTGIVAHAARLGLVSMNGAEPEI